MTDHMKLFKEDKNSRGSAVVAILLVVVILVAVGFAGWVVYGKQKDKTDTPTSLTNSESNGQAPFTKTSDIDTSIKELDKAAVDSDLNTADIDSDLNAVL